MRQDGPEQASAGQAGVDAGQEHHHVAVVDQAGTVVLSRGAANDEPALRAVITEVAGPAQQARRAIDLRDSAVAPVLVSIRWALLRDIRAFTPRPAGPGARAA